MNGPVLRDIHLPAEPGWWPPAPGWWVLAAVVLVAAVLIGRWLRSRLRRRRTLRQLDALVDAAADRHAGPADGAALAAALSDLLRRAARRSDPQAAALQGEAWLRWLDDGDPQAPFSRGPGRLLLDAPFQPALPRASVEPLLPLVRERVRSLVAGAHRG